MDEFLIILGLFAILGFIVFALIRSALVGSFFYKTGFCKTGLPKEKYAEYVKGKKAELRDTMGRICGEAATDLAENKAAPSSANRESAVKKYSKTQDYSQVMETKRLIEAFKYNGVDLNKISEELKGGRFL